MAPQTRGMLKRAINSETLAPTQVSAPSASVPARKKRITAEKTILLMLPPAFRLMDLPQEIIDMIYIEMLRAGHVGILRASHAVHERAFRYLERHGVYRISLEDGREGQYKVTSALSELIDSDECEGGKYKVLYSDTKTIQSIRNIEVRVSTQQDTKRRHPTRIEYLRYSRPIRAIQATAGRPWHGRAYNWLLSSPLGDLGRSKAHHDTCHVILETDVSDIGAPRTRFLFQVLCELTGFDRFSMEFRSGVRSHAYGWDTTAVTLHSKKKKMPFFEMVEQQLGPTLGPAKLMEGDVPELTFEPWKYQASLASEGTGVA